MRGPRARRSSIPERSDEDGARDRPLGWGTRLGYGSGQTGVQILRDMPNVLLPSFITLVHGLPAAWMSFVIFLPKLWIVVFDPWIGRISDATRSRLGRRRPYLLLGAILCPLVLIALFYVPPFGAAGRAAYVTALFALALTAASVFAIPHLSLAAEISSNGLERTKLVSARSIFLALGLVAGIGGSQLLLDRLGHGADGYSAMAAALALVCFASMGACFLATPTVAIQGHAGPSGLLREQLAAMRGNRPFLILTGFHVIQLFAAASNTTAFIFFMVYVVGNPLLLLPMMMLGAVLIISVQPLWIGLAIRHGHRRAYVFAVGGWSLATMSWLLVGKPGPDLVDLPLIGALNGEEIGVLARHLVIAFFNTGMTLLSLSMLTDTIEWDRHRTGEAREGALVGGWSALEKIGIAAGPLWVGPFLQYHGFHSGGGGHGGGGLIPQTAEAIWAIRWAAAGVPGLIGLLTIPLVLRYPLGKR